MGQHLRAIKRLGILLSIWIVAFALCARAVQAYSDNQTMRSCIQENQTEYDGKLRELTQLLNTQQMLEEDTQSQVALLKDKLGYCEPGEIPIVIVDKTAEEL